MWGIRLIHDVSDILQDVASKDLDESLILNAKEFRFCPNRNVGAITSF